MGKGFPGIEQQTAGSYGRYIHFNRISHTNFRRALTNLDGAPIFFAMGNDWPAIVPAGQDEIYFIATPGTMLIAPKSLLFTIIDNSLGITMTIAPDFRQTSAGNKRIVWRNSPIQAQAQYRTGMG